MMKSEIDYIDWIKSRLKKHPQVILDIGDDASIVKLASLPVRRTQTGDQIVLKTDTLIERVHFKAGCKPEQIGRKAITRALSDVAAIAGSAQFCLCSLTFKKSGSFNFAKRVFRGINSIAKMFSIRIVGGDVSTHDGPVMISITLVGRAPERVPRRSDAKAGDAIMVTGSLGGSITGKHLLFTPRVKEAQHLNKRFKIHSMIDISDGLIVDLWRICNASSVGAFLFEQLIPISRDAIELSRVDRHSSLEHAMYDGEDYELLFTCPVNESVRIEQCKIARRIGMVIKGRSIFIQRKDGSIEKVKVHGWLYKFR